MCGSQKKNSDNKKGKGSMKIFAIAVVVLVVAAVVAVLAAKDRQRTVGTDIPAAEITEFYCTTATSTNPAYWRQYRFYMEGEQWRFFHETRQGSQWPLTGADTVTDCGARKLSQQEYEQFAESISGGSVTKRTENADSGSRGPWFYLYWKGDKGKYQQFAFADYTAQQNFEQLCAELAAQ